MKWSGIKENTNTFRATVVVTKEEGKAQVQRIHERTAKFSGLGRS